MKDVDGGICEELDVVGVKMVLVVVVNIEVAIVKMLVVVVVVQIMVVSVVVHMRGMRLLLDFRS